MMLSTARFAFVMTVAVLVPAHAASLPAQGTPRAAVVKNGFDLGVVAVGQDVEQVFDVRNDGDAPLTLGKATVSRGGKVTAAPATIAPGQTGQVRLAVDTFLVRGKVPVMAAFPTNDPVTARLELTLSIEVKPFISIDPGQARYLMVQGAPAGTIRQRVWAPDADIVITGATSPHAFLAVAFREATAGERDPAVDRRQWLVDITLPTDAPVGALAGHVVLSIAHPAQKKAWIPVSGFVRPMFAVTPPAADLGTFDPKAPSLGVLVVKNFADESAELTAVTCTIAGLRPAIEVVEAGHHWRIRLSADPALSGPVQGTLRITTSSPKVPFIEVPLSGVAKPGGSA
jgi:hypothetical protein